MKQKTGQKLPRASVALAGLMLTVAGSQVLADDAGEQSDGDTQAEGGVQQEIVVLQPR